MKPITGRKSTCSRAGQQYDVLGYSKEQIIADALTQYERHLHFIYLATSEILEEE